ncbi:50S ribosomal protein L29 [Candidatus Woesearchaeota archaeon]|nr:50S ribosomal protein L29 [Candidatus Woesearchaeota archaeon]
MKFKDLQKKSPEDLKKELEKYKMDLMKYRAQVATGGAGKDAGKIREIKRTIARIMTLNRKQEVKTQQ